MTDPADDTPSERPARQRKSRLYDDTSGKLDVKKLAAWVGGIAAFLAAAGALGTQAESFAKWWLEIDELEAAVAECHERADSIDDDLAARAAGRDPNARLDDALPIITTNLREHRGDIRRLRGATTKLSTIHEYGLDRNRARSAAREATATLDGEEPATPPPSVRVRPPSLPVRPPRAGGPPPRVRPARADDGDPLAGLDGL